MVKNAGDRPNRLVAECAVKFKIISPDGRGYALRGFDLKATPMISEPGSKAVAQLTYSVGGTVLASSTTNITKPDHLASSRAVLDLTPAEARCGDVTIEAKARVTLTATTTTQMELLTAHTMGLQTNEGGVNAVPCP
ncbi:hypothetical protein GCM10010201_32280 [Pilimelia columellifera subsp. columellifera]|uniref:Uncharacterized protein n=1 Tax=Pilimelia columellifera subsp. columellifera TaxID=706583 RepID=A0ABN3NUH2_9ACTN